MPDTLAHICVNVPDAEAAVEWYTDNFAFEDALTWSWETDEGHTMNRYVADESGSMIQFREAEAQTEFPKGSGWDHIGIEVDDLDAAFERIDHHGVVMEPQYNSHSDARVAFIEDPWGYVIELLTALDA
jgi:lactoylglutathione lyase